jgi:hypothetical protein
MIKPGIKTLLLATGLGCASLLLLGAMEAEKPTTVSGAYRNSFVNAAGRNLPEDLTVLAGSFTVQDADGNGVLELAGEPLNSFGALFGPPDETATSASAKIRASSVGRRYPEFGLGLSDANGYKLWVMPGKKTVQLRHGADVKATAAYTTWVSGRSVSLTLEIRQVGGGGWRVQGSVSPTEATSDQITLIRYTEQQAPVQGRASIWGTPYSGKSLQFDDLVCAPAATSQAK